MIADPSTDALKPPGAQGWWLAVIAGDRRGLLAAIARFILAILSLAYRAALAVCSLLRPLLQPTRRADVPVVSVGNLTVGGTGKTPMVAFLAHLTEELGGQPLIVSRGYAARHGEPNEEVRELARLSPAVPHVTGRNRHRAIRNWLVHHPSSLAILDDGFQHRRLARDLDIVLVDALRPFGYSRLLPRGLLREPLSALRRADLLIITRTELAAPSDLTQLKQTLADLARPASADRPAAPILLAEHRPAAVVLPDGSRRPPDWLRGRDIAAACGIGHPEAFRRTLDRLGARIRRFDIFADHHAYARTDLDRLLRAAAAAGLKMLVTTGKDFVKWLPLLAGQESTAPVEAAALEVEFRIVEGEPILRRRIAELVTGRLRTGDV